MFDDYHLTLAGILRGESATQRISITNVRLELRFRKSHLIAIEAGELSAFNCRILIPNYVKAYASYLGMDPTITFEIFCWETGLQLQAVIDRSFVMHVYVNTLKSLYRIFLEFSWPVRLRFIELNLIFLFKISL